MDGSEIIEMFYTICLRIRGTRSMEMLNSATTTIGSSGGTGTLKMPNINKMLITGLKCRIISVLMLTTLGDLLTGIQNMGWQIHQIELL